MKIALVLIGAGIATAGLFLNDSKKESEKELTKLKKESINPSNTKAKNVPSEQKDEINQNASDAGAGQFDSNGDLGNDQKPE